MQRRSKRAVLVALWWAVRVEVLLRQRTLQQLCDVVGVRLASTAAGNAGAENVRLSPQDAVSLGAVHRLYRRWPIGRGTCLREALVSGRVLRYRRPVLRIGVRGRGSELEVHAWLELDGFALDPDHIRYQQLLAPSRLD